MYKIIGNEVSTTSSHGHSHIRLILCYPVDKSWMQSIPYSIVYIFLTIAHIYVNFFYIYRILNIRKLAKTKFRP